jgi:hypothetical protein
MSNLVSNLVYGMVASTIITKLGDDALFAKQVGQNATDYDARLSSDMYDPNDEDDETVKWAKDNMVH